MTRDHQVKTRRLAWRPLLALIPVAAWLLSGAIGCNRKAPAPGPGAAAAGSGISRDGSGGVSAGYGAEPDEPFDPIATNGAIFEGWPEPELVLVFSGGQHGYLEPCGCAGLENQKGGTARRHTFLKSLADRGWDVVLLDAGDQVRRRGRQALAKFGATRRALAGMGYDAAALGLGDFSSLAADTTDELWLELMEKEMNGRFVLSNASIAELADDLKPYLVVERAGRKIGVAAVIGEEYQKELGPPAVFSSPAESLPPTIEALEAEECDLLVLLAQTTWEEAQELAAQYPQFDYIATATPGEPRLDLQSVEDSPTEIVDLGEKGMFLGVVGLFDDEETPVRYQRVPLDSRFADSPEMKEIFASYQHELESLGFDGLGLLPAIIHPRSEFGLTHGQFAGSASCRECHPTAYGIWSGTKHAHATESLEKANPPRTHDPECLSCHVTGWSPQEYQPFRTGFENLASTPTLVGNGCENCHGPAQAHVDAEQPGVRAEDRDALRELLRLTAAEAKAGLCQTCHDHDNSPEFDFETYWPKVKHAGKR